MKFYVTDGDRIGNQFFDTFATAEATAKHLSKQFPGNRVNVFRLYTEASFYEPVDERLVLIDKCRGLLSDIVRNVGQISNAGLIDSNLLELKQLIQAEKNRSK